MHSHLRLVVALPPALGLSERVLEKFLLLAESLVLVLLVLIDLLQRCQLCLKLFLLKLSLSLQLCLLLMDA